MRWNDGVSVPDKNIKLHKVVILDCSGSMQGEKYNAAEAGVKLDYQECKNDFVDYLLVEFSNARRETLYKFDSELKFNPWFGGTALYSTIVHVFESLLKTTPKEDKVLVQIFTDGQDSYQNRSERENAKKLIEQFNAKGWTVTFVGTEYDVQYIQTNLSIDSTNTLVHDNTSSGVAQSFETYRGATKNYTKNVAKGVSVTNNFFKDINKNNG